MTPTSTARETTHIIRERTYAPAQLDNVIALLRQQHLTGTLCIDVSEGTLCGVRFREEQKVTHPR